MKSEIGIAYFQISAPATRPRGVPYVVEGWLMHRGGGVAGGGGNGGPAGGARGLDLEHPPMPGAAGFPWGAMLAGHHHHAAAAAAGMMQPPLSAGGEYAQAAAHHGATHPAMPMDLHVPQGFPYYR